MELLASLNGQILPLSEARVSVLDRGFLFGDGVYEVVRIYNGQPFDLEPHLMRLARSLEGLRLGVRVLEGLESRVRGLIARAAIAEATIYIQITRGAPEARGHVFPTGVNPTELLYVSPVTPISLEKRRKGEAAITYPDVRWARCDLKTVNLLGNILAAQAAKEADAYEAILVDRQGLVTEGSRTNVFAVKDGRLFTRPLGADILPGVTRERVMELARSAGLEVEERAVPACDLTQMDEVFLTGTTTEVMPIVRIDDETVGSGTGGPIAMDLAERYLKEATGK